MWRQATDGSKGGGEGASKQKFLGLRIWNLWFGSWFPSFVMLDEPDFPSFKKDNNPLCVYLFGFCEGKIWQYYYNIRINLYIYSNSLLLKKIINSIIHENGRIIVHFCNG